MAPFLEQTEYTPEICCAILDEALGLLRVMRQSAIDNDRLKYILANHFGNNDFRSFCCFGHQGDPVPLDLFNSLCILPSTGWNVHLVGSSPDSITPSWDGTSSAAVDVRLRNKFSLVSENINTLFSNILKSHPDEAFINSNLPFKGGIGPAWILSILGQKRTFSIYFCWTTCIRLNERDTTLTNGRAYACTGKASCNPRIAARELRLDV
jgi:hypothetical protein